jgi:Protein of unknown function (DUF3780)
MSGFDCEDHYLEHCYLVQIPRAVNGSVMIFEVFGERPPATTAVLEPEVVLRAEVAKSKWDMISDELRTECNRRLKAERKKAGRWSVGNNGVQRLLGKELLVLVWAVEHPDVTEERVAVAVRNWLGLKPEERWWLYTMTAASTGLAHQAGLGWRDALRSALCFGTNKDAFNLGVVMGRGRLPARKNEGYKEKPSPSRSRLEFDALRAIGLKAREAFA